MPLSVIQTGNVTTTRISQSTAVSSPSQPYPLSFARTVTRSFVSVYDLVVLVWSVPSSVLEHAWERWVIDGGRWSRELRRRREPENAPGREKKFATKKRKGWRRLCSYFNICFFFKKALYENSNKFKYIYMTAIWHSLSAKNLPNFVMYGSSTNCFRILKPCL